MAFSGALVKKSVDQTAADYSAGVVLTWDAETYDVGGWHDTGSNTSRLTVPSGVTHVRLMGQVTISSIAANTVVYLLVSSSNGATTLPIIGPRVLNGGDYQVQLQSGPLAVTAGDYFEMTLFTVGDASVTINSTLSFFSIEAIENFSGALVKKAATQTTADYSAGAVVTWDTEVLDVGGWHDTGSNTSRLTVPSGVNYVRVTANVTISLLTANADAYFMIIKNGDTNAATRYVNMPVAIEDTSQTDARCNLCSGPLAVTAGDYFEVYLIMTGDSSVSLLDNSYFSIEKLQ